MCFWVGRDGLGVAGFSDLGFGFWEFFLTPKVFLLAKNGGGVSAIKLSNCNTKNLFFSLNKIFFAGRSGEKKIKKKKLWPLRGWEGVGGGIEKSKN